MLQPKAYIKYLDKVLEVKSIRFDTKVIEIYDESWNKYRFFVFDFDEVEFIENTGFKDKNGKYIYAGDIVTLENDEYGDEYKVIQDEDELTFYLEPIKPFSVTDEDIQLRKSMEYRITIIER